MPKRAFDESAPLGRVVMFVGSFAPALIVLGLRVGSCTGIGAALIVAGLVFIAVWTLILLRVVRRRQPWKLSITTSEPADRDVAAYVATYLLPILGASPKNTSGYAAYALAAALILLVAYRADLGCINPIAYLFGYRAFRVSADDGARIILSKWVLVKEAQWEIREMAGVAVAVRELDPLQEEDSP